MTYFAQLDGNNVVTIVTVGRQEDAGTEEKVSLRTGFTTKETFDDGSSRKNFAGKGYSYDASRDAFIAPKPYPSWVLIEDTCQWQPPTAMPDDGKMYAWNEANTQWDEV